MFRQGAGGTAPAQDEFGIAFDAMPVGPRLVGFMIGSGIVAGLAYWLVAGRFSLGWRGQPDGRLTSREP